jgi:hypothetical protein
MGYTVMRKLYQTSIEMLFINVVWLPGVLKNKEGADDLFVPSA